MGMIATFRAKIPELNCSGSFVWSHLEGSAARGPEWEVVRISTGVGGALMGPV